MPEQPASPRRKTRLNALIMFAPRDFGLLKIPVASLRARSAHLKLFLEARRFVVRALYRLLHGRINVARLLACLHGAIARLLELRDDVAQAALVGLLLLCAARLLCLARLLMHCVHGLAQLARHRSCLDRPLRFVCAFLDSVDPLLHFTHLHDVLLYLKIKAYAYRR